MRRQVLESKVIALDDATVPVQDPTLDRTRTGRLWLYHEDREYRLLVYDYFEGNLREGEPPLSAFP
jgi:Transposase IS66 family